MRHLLNKILLLFLLVMPAFTARAQFYVEGQDPASAGWSFVQTPNYKIIYPRGSDSLAAEYAASLEKFHSTLDFTSGFTPRQNYNTRMPVVLHTFSALANGSVAWAPRNVSLYTTPDAYEPESNTWTDLLAVHEGRHISQMQFGRSNPLFRALDFLLGEMWTGAASAIWPGPVFFEGDAVVSETALTPSGRGRSADFLEYYRVSLADSLFRNYYQWSYGSQKRYTPDYYRAGYMLAAGMRTVFDEPFFVKRYFGRIADKKLPFYNLQKSVKEISGLKFKDAFLRIQQDFAREWAENDSLRRPETFGQRLTEQPRLYEEFSSLVPAEGGFYAVRSGLARTEELVFVGLNGKVRRLTSLSGEHSALRRSGDGALYWSEYRPNARWGLASYSVLRTYKGGKHTLTTGSHFYNPAPSDSLVCVSEYNTDASSGIAVLNASDGSRKAFYPAPAGFQAVESVWGADGQIYASAISADGFGIYRLPRWDCVLAPKQVKIKKLFVLDGLLWFTSDRSGVNELYSLEPDTGRLLQRTSTRFGADDFCFAGGRMYFTAPGTGDRAVYSIPADSLLSRPCTLEPLPRHRADKLSAQELPSAQADLSLSAPQKYSKAANLFKFHSWAPIYAEYDITSTLAYEQTELPANLGLTAWFQNELSTSYGQVGVSFERIPALHAQWVYAGFLPVLEAKLDWGHRQARRSDYNLTFKGDSVSIKAFREPLQKPYFELALGSYIPFNLSSGGWQRGIIPSFYATFTNDEFTDLSLYEIRHSAGNPKFKKYSGFFTKTSIRAYTMLPVPSSCIFPRWGIGAETGVIDNPRLRKSNGARAFTNVYAYLPGVIRTHGMRLSASFVSTFGSEWSRTREYSFDAEYALPFLALDWGGMSPWFYLRNFELRGYASYYQSVTAYLTGGEPYFRPEAYFGASLAAHLGNFLWIPYDTLLGVKYLYNPIHPDLSSLSLVFQIDL